MVLFLRATQNNFAPSQNIFCKDGQGITLYNSILRECEVPVRFSLKCNPCSHPHNFSSASLAPAESKLKPEEARLGVAIAEINK